MEISKLALVLGAAVTIVAGGVAITACSSSSGGNGGTPDSGSTSNTDSGTRTTDGSTSEDGSTTNDDGGTTGDDGSAGGDAGCKSVTLHANMAADIFCGYGDAGSLDCMQGSQCCLGAEIPNTTPAAYFPETCVPYGTTCTNQADGGALAVPIACNQISDCTANGVAATACCLQGASALTQVAGCSYSKATKGTAIVCEGVTAASDGGASAEGGTGTVTATACAQGELQVCSADVDCPSTAPHCVAGKWKIYDLGFCSQ